MSLRSQFNTVIKSTLTNTVIKSTQSSFKKSPSPHLTDGKTASEKSKELFTDTAGISTQVRLTTKFMFCP